MKIHSNVLTHADLDAALPRHVGLILNSKDKRSRSHSRRYDVNLYGKDGTYYDARKGKTRGRHVRMNEVSGHDASYAASYWEHGDWMARLFMIDPNAKIDRYKGREDFHAKTNNEF